ncbi:MAG: Ig-like domain repeat protein [Gaiellaceae bacterium]
MQFRRTLAIAVGVIAAVVLAGAPTALAGDGTSVALGTIGFSSVAVDDANSHVFVSGRAANEVLVFDFAGNLVTTIPNVYGAGAMVVQGGTLYVVEQNAGSIEAIDLATLADRGPVAAGLNLPNQLAFAGGKLWTGVNGQYGWAQLASVTLNGTVTVYPGGNYYDPDFGTSPSDPNTLYVANDSQSPGWIFRLDVSSGSPVVAASNTSMNQSNVEQVAVSPDGTRVIPAAGAPYNFGELNSSTLQPDGIVYPAQPYPSAVAVSPAAGGLLATGLNHGYSTPTVSVFRIGMPQAIFTASTSAPSGVANVPPHGLALSADGSRLFAVTADDGFSDPYHLWIFNLSATGSTTSTTVTVSPNPSGFSQQVVATATVTGGDGGGSVTFYANGTVVTGCAARPLSTSASVWTATCPTSSLPQGTDVVKAVYSGDALSFSSFGQTTTSVGQAVTSTKASTAQIAKAKNGTYTTTLSARLTAYGSPLAGKTIVFSGGGSQLCTAVTDSNGTASCVAVLKTNVTYRSLQKSGYTASFAGDAQYLASSGSATVTG